MVVPGPSGKPYQEGSVAVRNCLGPSSHPVGRAESNPHPGSNTLASK